MDRFRVRKLRRTTLIMLGLAAFLIGIGLARTKIYFEPDFVWIALALVVATYKKSQIAKVVTIGLFGLSLGWWRGQVYMSQLAKYQPLLKHHVVISGQADSDGTYSNSQLSFDLKNLQLLEPYKAQLVGKVSVKGFGESAVYRGDKVEVSGNLYPTRGSHQASLSYADVIVINRSTSWVENLRRKFVAGTYTALPEPLASFGLGLLIGQRTTLPTGINNQLSATGLTHIVAVSGYNLTIIMLAVSWGLKNKSKYQNTLISGLLIGLFIVFTGFSASIVRAAVVSGLTLAASYYGRTFKPMMIILLAAALTVGYYPIYLWSDIGWYLSFLAFFGVLIIAPLAVQRLFKTKKPKLLASVVAESLSAQFMALPLIMHIFGQVSLIALPANILVVPLVPLAMLVTFVAALAGMLAPTIAGWLAWPARILLTYMLDVVNLMSRVPHALSSSSLPLSKLIIIYAIISLMTFILWIKTKPKNATITDILTEDT